MVMDLRGSVRICEYWGLSAVRIKDRRQNPDHKITDSTTMNTAMWARQLEDEGPNYK